MHNASYGDHMASWDRLVETVARNASELSHLQRTREALARAQREAREARQRQAAARAAAQQATRDLEAAMAKAHEAATRLRSSLMGRYGRKNLKLIDYGMRPYPATRRRTAATRRGELPQRLPKAKPPVAAPERAGSHPRAAGEIRSRWGDVPRDMRTRHAGARGAETLGNVSPSLRHDVPPRHTSLGGVTSHPVRTDGAPPERRT